MKTPPLLVLTGLLPTLAPFIASASFLVAIAHAGTYHWTADESYSWDDSRNWSPSGIPGAGDDVIVSTSSLNAGGNRSVNSLTVSGGTVTGLGTLSADTLTVSSGSITGTGATLSHFYTSGGQTQIASMSLSDSSIWTGGRVQYSAVTVAAGGSISIPSGLPELQNATLTNRGTVTMTGGQIRGYDSAIIENHGTWNLQGHATPFAHYHGGNIFNNHGLLRKSNAATVISLANSWTYNLGGETRCDGGTLKVASNAGLPSGAQLTGAGAIHITATTQLTGPITETVASLQLTEGGTLSCSGNASFTGWIDWIHGHISGALTIPSGSTLAASGSEIHQLNTNAQLDNHGLVHWAGPAPIKPFNNNLIHNHSDGTFEIAADGIPFDNHYPGSQFTNDGTFIKSAGTGTATISETPLANNGVLTCNAGTIELTQLTELNNGSSITGTGTVILNGDIRISGTVAETINSLSMTGTTLTGTSPCAITGQLDWEGGIIHGALDVPAGSLLAVHGPDFKEIDTNGIIGVYGTLRWTGTHSIRLRKDSTLHIHPGGTCDLAAEGDPFDHYQSGNELINEGTLVKSEGSGGSTICDTLTIRNRGNIHCESSTLEFTNPNTLVFEETSTISGPGQVLLSGTMQLPGAVEITAPTTWTAGILTGSGGSMSGLLEWTGGESYGNWEIASNGRLIVSNGTGAQKILRTNATLNVSGTLELSSGELYQWQDTLIKVLSGGRCEATGLASIGTYQGGNVLEIAPDALLTTNDSGDLRIDSAVVNHGSLTLPAGSIACNGGGGPSTGTFHADSGSSLLFTGGTHDLDTGSTVTGPGNVRITSGKLGAIAPVDVFAHVDGGTAEGLAPDGEFRFRNGSSWSKGNLSGYIRIPNGATFAVDGSAGGGRIMNIYARLDIEGTLRWQGPGTIQPWEQNVIEIHPTGTMDFTTDGAPIYQYHAGSNLINHGTLLKSSGSGDTTLQNLTYTSDGVIECRSGRLTFNALSGRPFTLGDGSIITGAGRTVLLTGRTNLTGTTAVTNSTLELAGAELYGEPGINATVSGQNIEWSSGYISGSITWNGNASTTTGGFRRINGNGELRNAGTLTLAGSGSIQCWENSILRNLPGATLNAIGSVSISHYHSNGNLLSNEGTMNIGASPGTMTLTTPFEQTATGRLLVGVAGPAAFDILKVNNTATLAGTLVATLENGYNPPAGTGFEVVDAYTRTGAFSQTEAPRFDVTYPFTPGDPPVSHNNVVLISKDILSLDFDTWASDHGLSGDDALATADPDRDSSSNWIEYALNMNPNAADTQPLACTMEPGPDDDLLVLRYRTWENRINAGVLYVPEASADLSGWSATGISDETDPDAPSITGSEARKCSIPANAPRKYLHLLLNGTGQPPA